MKNLLSFLLLLTVGALHAQQPTPAGAQTKGICLRGARVHVGNGAVIENADVVFDQGKITYVGVFAESNSSFDVFNCKGKELYPGFIAPNSTLGLTEIEAVRATNDYYETGLNNASTRTLTAYFSDSKVIPTVRSNGVLLAQVTPRGGLISGNSSIMQLDAWNWEDAVVRADDGMHVNWPTMSLSAAINSDKEETDKNKNYEKSTQSMIQFFTDAKSYSNSDKREKNIKLEAALPLFTGAKTLFIHVDRKREMVDAVSICKKLGIQKIVLVGAYDAYQLSTFLKENSVAVMLQRPHSLPMHDYDEVDLPYKMAKRLFDAGVMFCIQNEGDMEAMNARNLPFLAGTCAAYGLPKEEAVAAVSLHTATILGIDKTCGSVEIGKDATLFVSNGDALDMKSNQVELAFIQGRLIALSSIQSELYQKYKTKYGLK